MARKPDYVVTRLSSYQVRLKYPNTADHLDAGGYTGTAVIHSGRAACYAYEVGGDPYRLEYVAGSRALFDRFVRSSRKSA